ncbi:MAG: hypothetical protein R2834_11855 [Rhodothermales bacterium]
MHRNFRSLLRFASLFALTVCSALPASRAYAQAANCTDALQRAQEEYALGRFDETIVHVDQCLALPDVPESTRRLAYRLKGLSYIGKGLESDAREAVQRLLEVSPNFEVDPALDPPAFVQLLEDVRAELSEQPAAGPPSAGTTQPRLRSNTRYAGRNKRESWYTNWGLGLPFISYPGELGDVLDGLKDLGVDNTRISLDLLGFYLPAGDQTIVGVSINAWGDRYDDGTATLQINAYTVGASAMYFIQKGIGEGPFVRAELGPARLVLDSSEDINSSSDWGLGVLVGAGYGIPVSAGTRILIHVTYASRRVEDESYGTFGLGVSGLF